MNIFFKNINYRLIWANKPNTNNPLNFRRIEI